MSKQFRGFQWKLALGIALLAALLLSGVALAYHITINTNDTVVDPGWTGKAVFISDASGDGTAGYDLLDIKMSDTTGLSPNFYNFLVANTTTIPADLNIRANLDCDNDGNFAEVDDRQVVYNAGNVSIRDGTGVIIPPASAANAEPVDLVGTDYGAEFKAPFTQMGGCATGDASNNVSVFFQALQGAGLTQRDTTITVGFNVPTAIDLVSVEGHSGSSLPLVLAAAAAVLLLGLSLALRRRRA